ncbi:MAG: hypothetical protein JWO05_922 [Gemmatimonadetes bacterium]|nr:hypothetical protein [Gemmatimonadota bacterium]
MKKLRDGRVLLCVTLASAAVLACDRAATVSKAPVNVGADYSPYVDPPAVRSFPATAGTVNAWVASADTAAVRAHGWDMWESITTYLPGSNNEPVWETWYSGHEIFEMDTSAAGVALAAAKGDMRQLVIPRRKVRFRPELPRQFAHGGAGSHQSIPGDPVGAVFSFNRYTQSTARQIVGKQLWNWKVLAAINDSFDRAGTPVALRQVLVSKDSTDSLSIVLKPVFQFIDGKGPSCIPYWAGDTPAVTDSAGMNPIPREWKQFVVVDPTDTLKVAMSPKGVKFAGCPNADVAYPVVRLEKFYHRTLTQEMVDSFSVFAANGGDNIGKLDSATVSAILAMVKPGNIGLLVAMHVTGKEIANWTWQSFWWSPTPTDSLGFDRPNTIQAPWNNYEMTTAYWMTSPPSAGAQGTPRIAYNPYLETSLNGTVDTVGGSNKVWYGPTTNCMSCHRMASWKAVVDTAANTACFTGPQFPYVPASYVDAGNAALLSGLTKTDFLWSVAIRTAGIQQCAAPVAARARIRSSRGKPISAAVKARMGVGK